MAQILPGATTYVANHKNSSGDKKSGTNLGSAVSFWQWLTPNKSESHLFLYIAQVLSRD